MKKLFCWIVFVILFNILSIYAQNNCPDPSQWTSSTEEYHLSDFPYCYAEVDYKTGVVVDQSGSHSAVSIDWSTLDNHIPVLKIRAIKRMMELDIVSNLIQKTMFDFVQTVYVYYESECNTTVSLWLNLVQLPQFECCDENFPDPEAAVQKYHDGQIYRSKEITKEVSCGTKCCARVYTGYWHFNNLDNNYHFILDSRNTVSITDCNTTVTYLDCEGNPIPCSSSCYDPNFEE
jgi:hypothetical protein